MKRYLSSITALHQGRAAGIVFDLNVRTHN